ncbi:hypothetical protein ACQP2P_14770 [Dactylosporangium sp. CA-139114]|uniref:hypothetical protein n=1 Tax=Dactylosporangium sp. CA-139114 TaxID=3239931 RepID=UPI003D991666
MIGAAMRPAVVAVRGCGAAIALGDPDGDVRDAMLETIAHRGRAEPETVDWLFALASGADERRLRRTALVQLAQRVLAEASGCAE